MIALIGFYANVLSGKLFEKFPTCSLTNAELGLYQFLKVTSTTE